MQRHDVAMRQGKTAVHATTVYPRTMSSGRDHMASFWRLISCRNFLMNFLYLRRCSQYFRRRSRSSSLRGCVRPRHIAWNSFFVVAISKRQKGRWMIQKDNPALKLKRRAPTKSRSAQSAQASNRQDRNVTPSERGAENHPEGLDG